MDDEAEVLHAAEVVVATEAVAAALEKTVRDVLVPVVEHAYARLRGQVTALDRRLTQFEQSADRSR